LELHCNSKRRKYFYWSRKQ